MKLSTYLVNSTKKMYVHIGMDYPTLMGKYLLELEAKANWDLRRDYIYVWYTSEIESFENVSFYLHNVKAG